jgi:hypothetical protein
VGITDIVFYLLCQELISIKTGINNKKAGESLHEHLTFMCERLPAYRYDTRYLTYKLTDLQDVTN